LIELADAYPATPAAGRATADAAAAYEHGRQYRAAGQTLRRLLKHPDADRAATLESLARVYLNMPGQLDAAIVRLDQLKQLAPAGRIVRPVTLEDGREIKDASYAQLSTELRAHRKSLVDAALPTFGLRPTSGGGPVKKPELLPPEKLAGVAGIIDQAARVRPDRVVIWQDDNKINQVAAGGVAPMHPPVPLPGRPRSATYAGDTLIAAGAGAISAVSPTGSLLWQVPINNLPDAEIARNDVAPDAEPVKDKDAARDDDEVLREVAQQQLRIQVRRGRIVGNRMNLGLNNLDVDPPGGDNEAGEEQIGAVAVLSDRVVFATGRGRVAAIDLTTGRVAWQMRPGEAALRKMAASEDFVVVATGDDNGSVDMVVLDTMTGQTVRRTTYDAGRQGRFINLALSPGGTLVTMLANKLIGRDLYDPAAAGWERPASANINDPAFAGSVGQKQLVISDDRVLAVATAAGQQHVRAYDLATGKPVMAQGAKPDAPVEAAFTAASTGASGNDSAVSVATVGPAFYVYGPAALTSYHLDKKDWRWSAKVGATIRGTFRDLLLAKDYAVLVNVDNLANNNADKVPAVQLNVFSRALSNSGNESGLLERHPTVRDPAGILVGQWQLAEGAFYYVAGIRR
jgi:outer membrane protein assembly factor BamB